MVGGGVVETCSWVANKSGELVIGWGEVSTVGMEVLAWGEGVTLMGLLLSEGGEITLLGILVRVLVGFGDGTITS